MGQKRKGGINAEAHEQIETFKKAGLGADRIANAFLIAENVTDTLERAEDGDIRAAKQAIELAAWYLNPDLPGQIPANLNLYLLKAFRRITHGESADIALHLKRSKGGKPNYPHKLKLFVGHVIADGVRKHGLTVEDASFRAEEHVTKYLERYKPYGLNNPRDAKTLQGWYYDVKDELEAVYQAIEEGS